MDDRELDGPSSSGPWPSGLGEPLPETGFWVVVAKGAPWLRWPIIVGFVINLIYLYWLGPSVVASHWSVATARALALTLGLVWFGWLTVAVWRCRWWMDRSAMTQLRFGLCLLALSGWWSTWNLNFWLGLLLLAGTFVLSRYLDRLIGHHDLNSHWTAERPVPRLVARSGAFDPRFGGVQWRGDRHWAFCLPPDATGPEVDEFTARLDHSGATPLVPAMMTRLRDWRSEADLMMLRDVGQSSPALLYSVLSVVEVVTVADLTQARSSGLLPVEVDAEEWLLTPPARPSDLSRPVVRDVGEGWQRVVWWWNSYGLGALAGVRHVKRFGDTVIVVRTEGPSAHSARATVAAVEAEILPNFVAATGRTGDAGRGQPAWRRLFGRDGGPR